MHLAFGVLKKQRRKIEECNTYFKYGDIKSYGSILILFFFLCKNLNEKQFIQKFCQSNPCTLCPCQLFISVDKLTNHIDTQYSDKNDSPFPNT